MKIIATAQPIGFGPVSNLVTLLQDCQEEVEYFGFGTCYEFLNELKQNPFFIRKEKEFEDTLSVLTQKKYDLLISVMGSKSAILAKKLGIPVLYLDLVFWMWEDLNSFDYYKKKADSLPIISLEELKNKYFFYEGQNDEMRKETSILSHFISDKSLVQEFIPCEGTNKQIIDILPNSEQTLPLMNDSLGRLSSNKGNQNALLFSLGGLQVQNDYRFVIRDLLSLVQAEEKIEVIGSKEHLAPIQSKLLNTYNYLNKVSQYQIVFAQPGFSTLYELMHLNVIPIILPAQNIGQLKFVHFLKKYLNNSQFIEWEDIYPNRKENLVDYVTELNCFMKKDNKLSAKLYKKLKIVQDYVEHNTLSILEQQQKFLAQRESELPSAKVALNNFIKTLKYRTVQ